MRRKDREIDNIEAIKILHKGEFGVLSMITKENKSYGIPLHFVFIDNQIYFHSAKKGKKIECLKNNNNVSFCVVGKTVLLPADYSAIFESVIASGIISNVEGEEKKEALMLLIEKYSNDFINEGEEYIKKYLNSVKVIKLSIESISGKARKQ
ncbi:MAG: pyridoxamine 5'-phosphate oxidase family protein [Bacteroidales bacterium]|nr:pyridoxamine 5'-phosphate oxidase family protein [Bacteroidales bacterium]MBN2758850.1 pyridoxamine 5'-phosphate oxidase family protein [Bacteroidales bacterium]